MPFGRVWAGHLGVIIRAEKSTRSERYPNMHQLSARFSNNMGEGFQGYELIQAVRRYLPSNKITRTISALLIYFETFIILVNN